MNTSSINHNSTLLEFYISHVLISKSEFSRGFFSAHFEGEFIFFDPSAHGCFRRLVKRDRLGIRGFVEKDELWRAFGGNLYHHPSKTVPFPPPLPSRGPPFRRRFFLIPAPPRSRPPRKIKNQNFSPRTPRGSFPGA